MQQHRQIGVLRRVEDRVVAAIAPQRVEAGARQVDADRVVGVALDLARGVLRVLRARDDRGEQRGMARRPLLDQPRVVGARQRRGVVGLRQHGELQQVVGEQHRQVDADLAQLAHHLLRRVDHPRRLVRGREARGQRPVAAGREAGDVEVALRDVRDVAQRDVPRPVAVGREPAGALVDVDVHVDDQQLIQRRASGHGSIFQHGGRPRHPPDRGRPRRALRLPVPARGRGADAAGRHRPARDAAHRHRALPRRPPDRRRAHLPRRRRPLRRQRRDARAGAGRALPVRRGRPGVDRVQRRDVGRQLPLVRGLRVRAVGGGRRVPRARAGRRRADRRRPAGRRDAAPRTRPRARGARAARPHARATSACGTRRPARRS